MIAVHLSSPDKFWSGLLSAMGRLDLAHDERFRTRDARVVHYEALKAELAGEFLKLSRAQWCERLEAQEVPFAPIWSVSEVMADPQVMHLGTFYRMQHPTQGAVTGIHRPVKIDDERGPDRMAAPALGEHTQTIFAEFNLG